MVAKRKIAFNQENSSQEFSPAPVMSKTVRRNARERNRVKQIDVGFEKLRTTIPTAANQKKISRVKILASAVDYIQHLHTLISEHESVCRSGPGIGAIIKQEPLPAGLPTTPKSTANPPHMMPSQQYPGYPGYPHHNVQSQYQIPSSYTPHTPISPISPYHSPMPMPGQHSYHGHHTPHSDSGYYSAHSPITALTPRSTNTCMTRRGARDSLSPGSQSSYSDTSGHGYITPASAPPSESIHPPSLTQDPTPSSTFREEDELLDSIVQWEKY